MAAVAVTGLLGLLAVGLFGGVHQVEEGHVGVYWRAGRLLPDLTEPGFHTKLPLIDRAVNVQVTMQTDSVTNIPCGTSGGVVIHFDRIEVVNRLKKANVIRTMREYGEHYDQMWIFDKIHHEINQFCSSHTLQDVFIDLFDNLDENLATALQAACDKYDTGIEIVTVRVTKPRIPESIRHRYEEVEAERASLRANNEKAKVMMRQAQAESERAEIGAEKVKKVRAIELEMAIAEKEAAAKMSAIADEMHVNHEKARADAALYWATKEAEANAKKLTPQFLQYTLLTSLANNTKIYFGEKIPTMFRGDFEALTQAKP